MTTTTTNKVTEQATRIVNSGKQITLKRLGGVTVRELSLEDVLILSQELSEVLQALQDPSTASDTSDGMGVIVSLMKTPATSRAIRLVAAATTNREPAEFENLGVGDWLRWANAFKEVADWEELKDLFTQLVPKNLFGDNLTTSQSVNTSQNSLTDSPANTGGLPKRS